MLAKAVQLLEEQRRDGWTRKEETRALIARATALAPDDPHAHLEAALVLLELGDLERASAHADAARAGAEHIVDARVRAALEHVVGRVMLARSELDRAEAHLGLAAELCADEEEYAAAWIEVLDRQGKARAAQDALREALLSNPRSPRLAALEEKLVDKRNSTQLTMRVRRRRSR